MEIKYDPNKAYKWTPDDSFTLSGGEFGTILNAFRAILSSQEAQRVLLAEKANKVMEDLLKRAVEAGIALEAEE